jgi:pyruvate formate lyase activating enzyme
MTLPQVLAELEAGRDGSALCGDALTLSGGEPMLQFPFTRALLEEARQRGMHTSLETCGYAARARYQQAIPLVDLFLFDYKATNAEEHARLTGVSNRAILSNLDFLLSNGAKVILRCPLVPGVNDRPDHMQGIAALSQRYPELAGIEIVAYHDTGSDKAALVGRHPALQGIKTAEETVQAGWIGALRALGCAQAVIA